MWPSYWLYRQLRPLDCLQNVQGYLPVKVQPSNLLFQLMDIQQLKIVADAEKAVAKIFKTEVDPIFVFHNLQHTRQVVDAVKEMTRYYQVSDDDEFILVIAAWFHDTGFIAGHAEEHEKESIRQAEGFINSFHTDQQKTEKISSCIQSTKAPQQPGNFQEKIICDADLYHLGTSWFLEMTDQLRQETQDYFKIEITSDQWRQRNIDFLLSHKYFTSYCQQKLEPVKKEWIKQLQKEK